MCKHRLDRNKREICLMTKYLENSDLGSKLKNDSIEKSLIKRFINICSSLMVYRFLKKDEILFYEGI